MLQVAYSTGDVVFNDVLSIKLVSRLGELALWWLLDS
jgi:hypothetical protein